MENKIYKTYVWSFLGRLSHWLLVLSLFSCFITSFYENLLTLHISLGIVVFGMFTMKFIWGIIGPKYARWSDYKFKLKDLNFYFVEKIRNRYRQIQPGHNPASSWFAFLVTWFGVFCCMAGLLLYGVQEGNGIFSYLNETYYKQASILESIHIYMAYLLLVLIFAHITGVLIEQFYHETNMVMSMVSGYKKAKGENISITYMMRLFGSIYIICILLLAIYSYFIPNNIITKPKFEKIIYKELNYDFYFECSDCHNLYPPFLLPKKSWINLMENQNKHFEEDLELDESLAKKIKDFLVQNSAENSTRESSYNIYKEIRNTNQYIITKTNYWKETHKHIKEENFRSENIEKKSNCVACHKNFEQGIISDINITYCKKVTKK